MSQKSAKEGFFNEYLLRILDYLELLQLHAHICSPDGATRPQKRRNYTSESRTCWARQLSYNMIRHD